ncbi:DEAD-box ATP-dependent RNA helicase 57 [Hordeum vulgare]|nr:DEAD-box ATP-dependent RNA helicase 57 [Hordeum vulgare]
MSRAWPSHARGRGHQQPPRQRSARPAVDVVEGFSVLKGAEAKEAVEESVEVVVREDEDEAVVRRRKEAERAAILRKRHDIHISGHNVPAPLESFEELVSRYDCDSYLVGNLTKLGV